MIKKVIDNKDKRITYSVLNKKCKEALAKKEYETVIMYSYAMIEDRLLSMLHYLYVVNRYDDKLLPTDYIDQIIRPLLKYNLDADKNKIYKINNITTKIKLIKLFNKDNEKKHSYIYDGYSIIEKNIGQNNLKNYFDELNKWLKLRNEIVHASFNKNINNLNCKLENAAVVGFKLAKLISKYTNSIKDNHKQISLRTKWEGINELSNELGIDINTKSILDYNILRLSYDWVFGRENLCSLNEIIDNLFLGGQNDLNVVIKKNFLLNYDVYEDYVKDLISFALSVTVTYNKLDDYFLLDDFFNISQNNKINIILKAIRTSYLGVGRGIYDRRQIDYLQYIISKIRNKYFSDFQKNGIDVIQNLLDKNQMYLIGLNKEMLSDIKLRNIVEKINPDCDFVRDYKLLLLDMDSLINSITELNNSSFIEEEMIGENEPTKNEFLEEAFTDPFSNFESIDDTLESIGDKKNAFNDFLDSVNESYISDMSLKIKEIEDLFNQKEIEAYYKNIYGSNCDDAKVNQIVQQEKNNMLFNIKQILLLTAKVSDIDLTKVNEKLDSIICIVDDDSLIEQFRMNDTMSFQDEYEQCLQIILKFLRIIGNAFNEQIMIDTKDLILNIFWLWCSYVEIDENDRYYNEVRHCLSYHAVPNEYFFSLPDSLKNIDFTDFNSILNHIIDISYDLMDTNYDDILRCIPKKILKDKNNLLELFHYIPIKYLKKYIDLSCFSNEEFVLQIAEENCFSQDQLLFSLIANSLKKDKKFLLKLINVDDNYFKYLDDKYKKDKEFILDLYNARNSDSSIANITEIIIKVGEALFPYIDDCLKNDIDVVKAAINYNWWEVEYIPKKFKKDKEIIELALNKNSESYKYLYEYIDDKKYIKELFDKYHFAMEYLPDDVRNIYNGDKKYMRNLISKYSNQINFLNNELKHDKEYIKELIRNNKFTFSFDDGFKDLFNDEEFLIDILKINKDYESYIPAKKMNKKSFIKKLSDIGIEVIQEEVYGYYDDIPF